MVFEKILGILLINYTSMNQKAKYIFLTNLFLVLVLMSHAQLQKFKVEIPQSPRFSIADSIKSVTIMNRSISDEFESFISDSLQIDFYKSNFDADRVLLDSAVSDTTIRVLGELLYESQRFDIVIPVDRYIPRYLSYKKEPEPLIWEYVESVCDLYKTDALIVLENLAMRAVTNYSKHYETWNGGTFMDTHSAQMDFYYRAHWRMYEPVHKTILVDVIEQDTLYWNGYEDDVNRLFAKLPSVKSALVETGIAAAIDLSKHIAPKWELETRYYYKLKNNSIDVAINYAAEGDWAQALELWLDSTETGNRQTRSKVMLNVALAYEMLGDIDNAIKWARTSKRTYYREVVNHYYKELLKRKKA